MATLLLACHLLTLKLVYYMLSSNKFQHWIHSAVLHLSEQDTDSSEEGEQLFLHGHIKIDSL